MPVHYIFKFGCFSLLLLGFSQASLAACDKTLSSSTNLASAVSSAPAGSTICLKNGSYGRVNLFNIARDGLVTIKSESGKSASIAPQVGKTNYVRFESLTISGDVLQNNCSSHIQWVDNDFSGRSLTLTNSGCGNLDTLIDGNRFAGFDVGGGYEGRLSLVYGSGITITNNFFGDGGASDGVQLVGGVSNVAIGPGNTFSGILDSLCGPVHCDAIQLYGAGSGIAIKGNYFANGDTFIMAPDGSNGVTVTDNVFNGNGVSYPDKIQFGSARSAIFEHNTVLNVRVSFDSKTGKAASSNTIARNNIMISGSSFKTANGNGCSNCRFTNNLFEQPTFIGGSNPDSWQGYQLTTSSLGSDASTSGKDMGPLYSASVATPLPIPGEPWVNNQD